MCLTSELEMGCLVPSSSEGGGRGGRAVSYTRRENAIRGEGMGKRMTYLGVVRSLRTHAGFRADVTQAHACPSNLLLLKSKVTLEESSD